MPDKQQTRKTGEANSITYTDHKLDLPSTVNRSRNTAGEVELGCQTQLESKQPNLEALFAETYSITHGSVASLTRDRPVEICI